MSYGRPMENKLSIVLIKNKFTGALLPALLVFIAAYAELMEASRSILHNTKGATLGH